MQSGRRLTNGSGVSGSSWIQGWGCSRSWPARGACVRVSRPQERRIQATAGLACSKYTCLMRGRSAAEYRGREQIRGNGTAGMVVGCRASGQAGRQALIWVNAVDSGRHEGNRCSRSGQRTGQACISTTTDALAGIGFVCVSGKGTTGGVASGSRRTGPPARGDGHGHGHDHDHATTLRHAKTSRPALAIQCKGLSPPRWPGRAAWPVQEPVVEMGQSLSGAHVSR